MADKKEYHGKYYRVKNSAPGPRILHTLSATGAPDQTVVHVGEELELRMQKDPTLEANAIQGLSFTPIKEPSEGPSEAEQKQADEHAEAVAETKRLEAEQAGRDAERTAPRKSTASVAQAHKGGKHK